MIFPVLHYFINSIFLYKSSLFSRLQAAPTFQFPNYFNFRHLWCAIENRIPISNQTAIQNLKSPISMGSLKCLQPHALDQYADHLPPVPGNTPDAVPDLGFSGRNLAGLNQGILIDGFADQIRLGLQTS